MAKIYQRVYVEAHRIKHEILEIIRKINKFGGTVAIFSRAAFSQSVFTCLGNESKGSKSERMT